MRYDHRYVEFRLAVKGEARQGTAERDHDRDREREREPPLLEPGRGIGAADATGALLGAADVEMADPDTSHRAGAGAGTNPDPGAGPGTETETGTAMGTIIVSEPDSSGWG